MKMNGKISELNGTKVNGKISSSNCNVKHVDSKLNKTRNYATVLILSGTPPCKM